MKLIDHIKQMLCEHEYETKDILDIMIINGRIVQPTITICKKCGKVLRKK